MVAVDEEFCWHPLFSSSLSTTRMAAFVGGMDLVGVVIVRGYGLNEFREDMKQFMSGIKDPGSDQGTERRMAEALAGGRGQAKRHYAVNKELYGTEEGVKQRNMAEEEQRKKEERRKRRTKGSGVAAVDGKKPSPRDSLDVELKPRFGAVRDLVASIDGKQVAVVTSVGFLALATGFVVGGRRQ